MLSELYKSVLTLLVSFAVRWFFALIGIEISDETFFAIVGAIVVWILKQLPYELTVRVFPGAVKRGLLKEAE